MVELSSFLFPLVWKVGWVSSEAAEVSRFQRRSLELEIISMPRRNGQGSLKKL